MNLKHFGDSYDIVKKSMLKWLSAFGPWAAHPMFTLRNRDNAAFAHFLGVRLVSNDVLVPQRAEKGRILTRPKADCTSVKVPRVEDGLAVPLERESGAAGGLFGERCAESRQVHQQQSGRAADSATVERHGLSGRWREVRTGAGWHEERSRIWVRQTKS